MSKLSIWADRNQGKSPAVTMTELYERVESFLWSLKADPVGFEDLSYQSDLLLEVVPRLVTAVTEKPPILQAQNLTLEALGLGMVLGACDGTLLFHCNTVPAPAEWKLENRALDRSAKVLAKNLSEICLVAQTNWREAHIDDLHLLSGYGKQQNLNSLQEGAEFALDVKKRLEDFQQFLLACVKGGYAMGMAEAALIHRT